MTKAAARRPQLADTPVLRPFRRSLPMRLMQAREAVMQRFRPSLRAHGVTDQQWRIIRALEEADELEISQLGERCVIAPASLSRILPKLDARGLITRRANAADQRRIIVSLTPAGRKLFAAVAPFAEAAYATIGGELGDAALQELYRLLDRLIDGTAAK
ncbi:MAG: homoprotocatechuate degradation operon regulator HpaR [Rhodospirillales bacterium]|nr:homoprotocatechuate degradation operon regulator HpaR [Rhodospirillales bacterium]